MVYLFLRFRGIALKLRDNYTLSVMGPLLSLIINNKQKIFFVNEVNFKVDILNMLQGEQLMLYRELHKVCGGAAQV